MIICALVLEDAAGLATSVGNVWLRDILPRLWSPPLETSDLGCSGAAKSEPLCASPPVMEEEKPNDGDGAEGVSAVAAYARVEARAAGICVGSQAAEDG